MTTLITGGAGFIGVNLADRLLTVGDDVIVYDNLSRRGSSRNLVWLRERHPKLRYCTASILDEKQLFKYVAQADRVFHLAAQVAVTTSVDNPMLDADINLLGTLNVLEAIRIADTEAPIVFASTNKVYGELASIDVAIEGVRGQYRPVISAYMRGISETQPLDFSTPYGCSKGSADMYVRDYTRTYDIPGTVLRLSCVYGPHQNGTEDQGWVAHFVRQALSGEQVTVYGDGYQVRDLLHVADACDALIEASFLPGGHAYNIGGGPANAMSVRNVLDQLGVDSPVHLPWRPSDQRWYVSNNAKFTRATGWLPRVDPIDGIQDLRAHMWANLATTPN